MGLGGVAIAILPSIICLKLTFSDGLGGVILLRWILRELKDISSHLICIANNPIGPKELPTEVMWTDWEGSSCLNNSPTKGINVIIRNPLSTERKMF